MLSARTHVRWVKLPRGQRCISDRKRYAGAYSLPPKKSPLRHSVRRRPWFVGFLIALFLTVQLAAAAYACAGSRYQIEGSQTQAALTESCSDMAEMADSDHGKGKGDDQKALCLAHCQADSKSADHVSPQIPAFLPVLVSVVEPAPVVVTDARTVLSAEARPRAPPPPLSILHCCFRT